MKFHALISSHFSGSHDFPHIMCWLAVGRHAAAIVRGPRVAVHTSRLPILHVHLQQSADAQTAAAHRAEAARVLLPENSAGLFGERPSLTSGGNYQLVDTHTRIHQNGTSHLSNITSSAHTLIRVTFSGVIF